MSADNQQERLKITGWITGFVDGEGCFSISIFRNKTSRFGWQVFPEFAVTQGEKSLKSLDLIRKFFGCGKIFVNRRHDNHKENIYRYCIRSPKDLSATIIPFFNKNKLRTSKIEDFKYFSKAIGMIIKREHLSFKGMGKIASIASNMNRKKPSKFLESPETIRQSSTLTSGKI